MYTSPNFYVSLIYLLAAIPYAWMGLFAWRKNPAPAVMSFAWAMLGLSIWTFSYSLELFLPLLPLKLVFAKIGYCGSITVSVFLLFFALEYTDKSYLLNWRARLLIWGVPILSLLLVWSNDFHHLVWSGETILTRGEVEFLSTRHELFFWVQTIYSNGLAIFAGILLAVEMLQRSRIYRIQISFVILGIIVLVMGSLLDVSRFSPIPILNITPLLFLPIVAGISWTIARHRMLDIIPLEHLTVLKNMRDGVIVVNFDSRILYINPLAESLFGHLERDIIGQPLEQISERYGAVLSSRLDGKEHQTEIKIDMGRQSQIFEVTISPVASRSTSRKQSSPGSIVILHDITKRKNSEAALRRRETMMSALNLAAERFLKESTWEHNIPGILEKLGQAIDISRVYVFMNYSSEDGVIYTSQCYEWAAAGFAPQINNPNLQHINLREAGYSRWLEELSKGKTIHGAIRGFPESEQALLQEQNVLSVAIVPVFVEKQWWGFIGFDECQNERQWEEAELEALHITASIFGSAEARARTEQRLIRRQQTLTLQQEIVREALEASTLRHMAQNIVDRLAHLISADDCFITLWDEHNQQTFPLASHDSQNTYLSIQPVSDGKTLTEMALQMGHTLIVEDAYNSPYLEPEIARQCPSHSLIVLPLTAAEKKLGAILLAFNQHHRFQPEEILVCEQASNLIALAFEKFSSMEQAQRRAVTSETLRKVGATVAETLETGEAVERILEQLKQVIPYDTASVQLLKGNELEIIGGSGFEDLKAVIGIRFAVPSNNPNTVVIETGKPYLLEEVGDVYEEFKKAPHNHIRSWLGAPLIFQERIIGLLAIDSSESNHFTREDISLASAFANQVAVTLENTRVYEKAQSQAITDPLTSVYNRRGLFQVGEFELARTRRITRPLCLLMLDIDHFKRVNDHYGHATGDQALRGLTERCRTLLRSMDIIGRYGGEEFVIILPETPLEAAKVVAERVRLSFVGSPLPTDSGPLRITISIGVAEAGNPDTLQTLIERADAALYSAKNAGRNCVRVGRTP